MLTEYTAYLVQEPGTVAAQRTDNPPPPASQVGAMSVAQARREAKSASATSVGDALELDRSAGANLGTAETKRAGGRLFVWRDSAWTDLRHQASLPVVSVAPFSDAYFALLAALPELVQPAALEPAVLVAGRRVSVKITAAGSTDWRPGEMERVVREFRE